MPIIWPEETDIRQSRSAEAVAEALELIGAPPDRIHTATVFPCVLARESVPPTYAGKIIFLSDEKKEPVAIARQVFGRHIASISRHESARRFAATVEVMRRLSTQLDPVEYTSPVYVLAPEVNLYTFGLSPRPYRKLSSVMISRDRSTEPEFAQSRQQASADDREFVILNIDDFQREFEGRLDSRKKAQELAIRNTAEGIEGLPN